ncbi:unnamed protein product [Penicillium pancosmium]
MDSDPKRETLLPYKLDELWHKQERKHGEQPSSQTKAMAKASAYRLGVPIKPSKLEREPNHPRKFSPNNYHTSYNMDQAGPAVIALKDTETFPICLIKRIRPQKWDPLSKIQLAGHKNLVCLMDYFQSEHEVHLVYEYEHLAISLGCVAGTVSFSEADIATVCKELLEGLKYVHDILKIAYGMLDFSNILLTWQGEVKLANIGESFLSDSTPARILKDVKDVGSVVIFLSDRAASLRESDQDMNTSSLSKMANSFVQRTKEDKTAESLMGGTANFMEG